MLNTEITEPRFQVCVVILTHNRKERCLDYIRHTAAALQGIPGEILVMNNGADHIPLPKMINGVPCRLINLDRNAGVGARNIAMGKTESEFLIMLDDDAYLEPEDEEVSEYGQGGAGRIGVVEAMIRIFQSDPKIGAVAFSIYHNDHAESCLLPTVFHGCGCGFRSGALKKIGGYPADFLYYGEEYSVAFRLYQAGYRIVMSDELKRVHHARDSRGRNTNRIMRLLIRNNTSLWVSSFPWQAIPSAVSDTLRRYFLVARKEKALCGFMHGCAELPGAIIRGLHQRSVLSRKIFRKITLIDQVETICNRMQPRQGGVKMQPCPGGPEVIICGVGKFPSFWLKILAEYGISVRAFWDTNSCWKGQTIHGVPVCVHPEMYRSKEASKCRSHDEKTYSHTPMHFLVGTSSLSETGYWKKHLAKLGLYVLIAKGHADSEKERGAGSAGAESFSPSGTFDLLETNMLEWYSEP